MSDKSTNEVAKLSENTNVLVVGVFNNNLQNLLELYFTHIENIDFNENTLEILNNDLYSQYDLILFSFDPICFEIFSKNTFKLPDESLIVIESSLYLGMQDIINSIASLIVLPIEKKHFEKKISHILSIQKTNIILNFKDEIQNEHHLDKKVNNLAEFLEKYRGNIFFLYDNLNDNLNRLKDLEISSFLIENISKNILELENILNQNTTFSHLTMIIQKLRIFLNSLCLENINPINYEAFDYLTSIIEDIMIYLNELFLYKLFEKVKVFEDSLENNIQFFKDSLSSNIEETDNLEFF